MKKFAMGIALALLAGSMGCIGVYSPAIGAFYTDVNWNQSVTSNSGASKKATDTAYSFFACVALGDVSVSNLAEQAGIKTVHHVDTHTHNILGFGWIDVTVYGE